VQITGARGPAMLLLSIAQTNPLTPSPSHSATDSQCSRFSVQTASQSALAGAPEPALGGRVYTVLLACTELGLHINLLEPEFYI